MTLGKIPFLLIRLGARIHKRTPLIPKLRPAVYPKNHHITIYEPLIP